MMAQTIASPPRPGQRLRMSYEEFLELDDDIRAEWVKGEVIVFMPPLRRHVLLASWFSRLVGLFLDLFDLGDVYTSDLLMRLPAVESARMPDVTVVLRVHADRNLRHGIEGPGDLVVEFISEDSVRRDRSEKFAEYARAGVPEYIMYDTRPGKETFEYFRLGSAGNYEPVVPDAEGRYHSAVLPGFWLDARWFDLETLPNVFDLMIRIAPEATRARLGAGA